MLRRTEVLESVFAESVSRGERAIDQVRAIAAGLAAVSVLISDWGLVTSFATRSWISLTGLGVGAALSALSLARKGPRTRSRLALSIVLDALVVTVAIAPTALWPRPDYPGQLLMPSLHFYGLAIVLSGMRLDRGLVRLAIGLNCALALGFVSLDHHLNGPPAMLAMGDITLNTALFVLYALLGTSIAGRTRRLVVDGSESVLQAERARQALGVYVSEAFASEVLDMDQLQPGGSVREAVVMFSDLRGFTAYADGLPPDQLVAELNGYLDAMVEVIRSEGGVVDKYIGDAIMVVFGLPQPRPDDADRAVRCAARMQAALQVHNTARAAQNLPPLRQGLGLHRGPVVAGNIGSADRLQYTVIGATVNLASRLESATKDAGTPTLISSAVVDALSGPERARLALSPFGTLNLRGASEPVEAWTLAAPPPA